MTLKDALYSRFIIDGAAMEFTPAELLGSVMYPLEGSGDATSGEIVDESVDPNPLYPSLKKEDAENYLAAVAGTDGSILPAYGGEVTLNRLGECITDSLFREGDFHLEDLRISAKCSWNSNEVGNMAALYRSLESMVQYIDNLGLTLGDFKLSEGDTSIEFSTQFSRQSRIVPEKMTPDPDSWIVYIPFDTACPKLGGSALAQALDFGGTAPQTGDADYLMDCYEVVREFAVDGILSAATPIGKGGMYAALKRMTGEEGAAISLSDILRSCEGSDPVSILFSEIPGVLVQIADSDFDYLDAQMLLQDVQYFPLGHPAPESGITVSASPKSGIQTILESLLQK